jgi:hypothetical protein
MLVSVRTITLAALAFMTACKHSPSPVADSGTPAPTAPPAPAVLPCTLPPGTGVGECPRYDDGVFVPVVDAAIDRVIAKHPEYFALDGTTVPGILPSYINEYLEAVPAELRADGYCAIFDGREVAVKNTNDFSEQYHIWWSSFRVRRGSSAYRATCTPAWF